VENQKWPWRLTLIRHAQSSYNLMSNTKRSDSLYIKFKESFDLDPFSATTKVLALKVNAKFALKTGDHDTPLAPKAWEDAVMTGKNLSVIRTSVPDTIYVSPYTRTLQTLDAIKEGWPALKKCQTVEDERIREQEHGLSLLYANWRVFFALNPEQKALSDLQKSYWYQYPQGESVPMLRERLKSFMTTLTREHSGQDILVITHHLSILSFRANFERLGWEKFIELDETQKPINCGVTEYRSNPGDGASGMGKLKLQYYNKSLL